MGRAARRARRGAARRRRARLLPPPPRVGAPVPAAPAHRARGAHPHREGGHRAQRVGPAVQRADLDDRRSTSTARRSASRRGCRGCSRPTASVRARGGRRRSPRRSRPACARARSCSTRCSPTRRPTTGCVTTTAGSRAATSPTRRATSRSQALVDAVVARYDIPQRWYTLKAQLLGLDRLADYDRMASVADAEDTFGWTRRARARARRVRARSRPSSPTSRDASSTSRGSTRRSARASGRARSARTPCRRTIPYLLLNWTARRRDVLTLAHELGHGAARVPRARAGRVPPDDAAHAGRDRVGVRRDGHLRPPARRDAGPGGAARAARREPRGPDRDRVPPDRDEPLRGRGAHRAARARASCRSTGSASCGPARRPTCSATRSRSPTATAPGGRTSRTSSARPATCTRTRTASCSRCRCTASTRSGAPSSCRRTSSCCRAAARSTPEELGRIVGVDLADPGVLGRRPRDHRGAARRGRAGRQGRRPAVASTPQILASSSSSWSRPIEPSSRARVWNVLEVEVGTVTSTCVVAGPEPHPFADLVADRLARPAEVAVDLARHEVGGEARTVDDEVERDARASTSRRVGTPRRRGSGARGAGRCRRRRGRRASPGRAACRARRPGPRSTRARPSVARRTAPSPSPWPAFQPIVRWKRLQPVAPVAHRADLEVMTGDGLVVADRHLAPERELRAALRRVPRATRAARSPRTDPCSTSRPRRPAERSSPRNVGAARGCRSACRACRRSSRRSAPAASRAARPHPRACASDRARGGR